MSKSPVKSPVSKSVNLNGVTASEMEVLIKRKKVTAEAVVSFLRAKEAAHGLKFPARELLAELAPAPAKPAKVVAPPPAKPGKVVKVVTPTPAFDAEGVIKRLDALERVVSALVERFAPAKPAANRRKAS